MEKWASGGCSRILGGRDGSFLVARHLRNEKPMIENCKRLVAQMSRWFEAQTLKILSNKNVIYLKKSFEAVKTGALKQSGANIRMVSEQIPSLDATRVKIN